MRFSADRSQRWACHAGDAGQFRGSFSRQFYSVRCRRCGWPWRNDLDFASPTLISNARRLSGCGGTGLNAVAVALSLRWWRAVARRSGEQIHRRVALSTYPSESNANPISGARPLPGHGDCGAARAPLQPAGDSAPLLSSASAAWVPLLVTGEAEREQASADGARTRRHWLGRTPATRSYLWPSIRLGLAHGCWRRFRTWHAAYGRRSGKAHAQQSIES